MTEVTTAGDVVVLPARVDLVAAKSLHEALLGAQGDVGLDAQDVTILSTPALQVIMAGRDHFAAGGRQLRIAAPSDAFLSCLRTLGVPFERIQPDGETS